ncbi:putative bifunctional diguanylate cyclase/phosphodiesterase [Fodinicurvata fenggangensis]|uniref:putative bifunctional diguanylate cyclase/phosphodiesterase n=1 Tax=Fodinicurvata fenggangensis TaxID=1121830 RepID=UPI00068AF17E|nr:GGDEF domain-containing phosphodiesterase [Fodinicurvata fenggangensis]
MFWRSHIAEKAALLYLAASTAWIVFSDQFVELAFPEDSAALQTGKGIFFVLAMTVAIYLLVRILVDRRSALQERYAAERIVGQLLDDVLADRALAQMFTDLSNRLCHAYKLEDIWILQKHKNGQLTVIAEGTGKARGHTRSGDPNLLDKADQVLRDGRPLILGDEGTSAHKLRLPGRHPQPSRISALFPLTTDGSAFGVLVCFERGPNLVARRLKTIFEDLGRSIAVAWQANEQNRRLLLQDKALFEIANSIVITDADGIVLWVNRAYERMTGFESHEVVGHPMAQLRQKDRDAKQQNHLWRTILAGKPFKGELAYRRKDGTLVSIFQTVTPIHADGGAVTHFIAVQEDITARKQAEERLMHLSRHDLLTGLPNRTAFNEHITDLASSSRANERKFAILMLDIGQLGRINETWGHEAGDAVLIETARRLKETVPIGGFLARYGNDEFVTVLPYESGINIPMKAAQDLLDAMTPPFVQQETLIHCHANIGVALFPQDARQTGKLLRNAELALQRAEKDRGLSYCFYSAEIDEDLRHRTRLREELYAALDRDELQLLYQPQVCLTTNEIVGAEALLRWRHPERGLLAPGAFMDVAEESEVIQLIGNQVFAKAVRQAAKWAQEGHPIRVAVNLSFAEFARAELVETIREELEASGLDPKHLELELTESMLAQDMEQAAVMLQKLHALGLSIAVDDFGTGYSSLAYLYRYRVDRLKIDRSFVRDIGQDHTPSAIVEAMIGLGHTLGMKVTAEGVETDVQRQYLQQLGCDEIQGFLISHPLPPDQLEQFLKQSSTESPRQAGMS